MITPRDWERVRELFQAAVELPPEAREAFLRDHEHDATILEEVRSLLRAHPGAEGFLSSPHGAGDVGTASRLSPGDRLGAFQIVGLIGEGGMGEVYRALDTRLDRTVAIKVLSPGLANDPHGRERFEREAHLVSQLNHPHICTLHDVGSAVVGGYHVPFLVMELLEGETLAARLSRGPIPVERAIAYALEIAEALATAHSLGIVHRDVKPANIMLTKAGVKLLDFGLARLRVRPSAGHPSEAPLSDSLTDNGFVLGTIPYMAPEQVRGAETDPRTDIFAFGAVFHEMLTGRRAFVAPSGPALVAAILEHEPSPPTVEQPLAPPALDHLVAACLAKNPADRWQDTGDVVRALRGIADPRLERGANTSSTRPSPMQPAGAGSRDRRWALHAAWAAAVVVVSLLVGTRDSTTAEPVPPSNPRPVIVLMDSPLPGRVYDDRTLAAGGTNADDVSDALRDLPVLTFKENTSPIWHREEQVREQNPDLVVSHMSCLLDQRFAEGNADLNEHLFSIAESRLMGVFAYLATTNPRARFLVYSRGRRWPNKEAEGMWKAGVVARFPVLKGRLFTMLVPGGSKATFRDPAVAESLRTRIQDILAAG